MPAPTYDDIFRAGTRALAIRPTPFTAEVARESESTANIVCHVNASMSEETAVFAETKLAEIEFASAVRMGGAVLDRLAYDRYGEELEPRMTAQVAVVPVELRREGTVGVVFPKDSRIATTDGVVYRTIADLLFPENELGPLEVFAYATVAGPDGNVADGTLTTVLDQPADDDTFTVTNSERAAGGHPEEEDGEFANRMRGFWGAARKATKTAVEYAASAVGGVASVLAEEILDPLDDNKPTYRATLTIADRFGNANAALADKVRQALIETRALGVPIAVFGSTPVYLPIELHHVAWNLGQDTPANRQAIREAIVADMALFCGTGVPFTHAVVIAALQRFVGKDKPLPKVVSGVVKTPSTDINTPTKHTAYRTRPELIIINKA